MLSRIRRSVRATVSPTQSAKHAVDGDTATTKATVASSRSGKDSDRLADSVEDAARRMGISVSLLYRYIQRGEIGYVKIGRRTLILREEQERFLDQRACVRRK